MANEQSYDSLVERLQRGEKLPRTVLFDLRNTLSEGAISASDAYRLIYILGRSEQLDAKEAIANCLNFTRPDDPDNAALVRRISIQVLGGMWRCAEYFSAIAEKAFKEDPYVRAVAATSLATLALYHPTLKQKAAALLLKGFGERDPAEPEVWESFYQAILELLAVPHSERPRPARLLKESDINQDVILDAQRVAAGKSLP